MITALMFAIGIILIAFVMAFFGLGDVLDVMAGANTNYIVLAAVVQVAILVLISYRLILISKKYNKLGLWQAFKISMSGMTISMLTPIAKIGGEPLKIYMMKKQFGGSRSTAIIAVDTIAEMTSSLFVVFVVFMLFARDIPGVIASSFFAFLVVVAFLIAILLKILLNPGWMRRLLRWTSRKIVKFANVNKKDYARLFYEAFKLLIKDRRIVTSAFGVSFVTKILEFLRMWLVFAAIGVFLPAEVVVIVWSVILVLYLVPWLPGSLGLIEFFGAGVFVFFGIASTTAAGGILIDRFISYWMVLVIGMLIISRIELPERLKK